MKKIYTLVLAVFVGVAAMAADNRPRSGMVTVLVRENSAVRITVDGRNYSDRNNDVSISNLTPGYHSIQVFAMNYSRSPFGIFGRNREQLLWSSSLYVSAGKETDITINRNGKAKVKEFDMPFNAGWGNDRRDDDHHDRDRDGDHDRDRDHNGGYDNNRYPNNGSYNGSMYPNDNKYGVSFQEMQTMKQTLMNERWENNRVSIARDMFNGHAFVSSQVRELLQFFPSEDNKLDLAKYAYRNVIDKSNYYVVFDVFSYNSSKQDLSNYMNNYR